MKISCFYCCRRGWKLKNKKLFWMIFLSVAIVGVVLLIDLLTKYYIFKRLPNNGNSMDVMPGFINFVHVENKGAAWGIMAGRPIFLIIVSIVILALYLTFYILKLKHLKNGISPLLAISAGLIAGGCFGNLFDRLVFGYVRDFINFQFFNFPVFNFADVAVTCSIILMVVYLAFVYPKESDSRVKSKNIDKNAKNMPKNDENSDIIIKNPKKEELNDEKKGEDDEGGN